MEKAQILEILEDWNDWQSPGETGTPREALAKLKPLLGEKQILAIAGVRRSGKSTLMRQLGEHVAAEHGRERHLHVNFEDPRWLPELGPALLDQIVQAYRERHNPMEKAFLFLDEVQEVPDWERWVRSAYDRGDALKIVISGSTASLIGGTLGSLLTGRHLSTELYPFSLRERLLHKGVVVPEGDYHALRRQKTMIRGAMAEQMEWGGFPEACGASSSVAKALLQQYFEDIIARDIVFRRPIRDVRTLRAVAQFAVTNISNEMAVGQMAKTFGISPDTVREYVGYLQEAYLVSTVPYASPSLKVVARRNQKAYAIDCGLRNAVSHRYSRDTGRLAENMAYLRLREQGIAVQYWRNGGEVDFVVELEARSLLINVSHTDSPPEREIRSLQLAMSSLDIHSALLVSDDVFREPENLPEGRVATVPLWYFLVQPLDILVADALG